MLRIGNRAAAHRALAAALTALVVLSIGAAVFLHVTHRSAGALVVAGNQYTSPAEVRPSIPVADGPGYDGQFFFRLAHGPFTSARVADGIALDTPAYRAQRVLYPLLAWLVASPGGGWRWLPVAMLAVNLVAWAVVAGAGVYLALRWRRPPWHGLLPALYPGLLLSTVRDLSEVVSTAFVVLALSVLLEPAGAEPSRRRSVGVGSLLSLAVLARETTMVVVAGLLLAWAWARWRRRRAHVDVATWAVPAAVFVTWQLTLTAVWGRVPVLSGGSNLGVPLEAMAKFLFAMRSLTASHLSQVALAAAVLAAVLAVVLRSRSGSVRPEVRWGLGVAVGLWVSLSDLVWTELWAFMRAGSEVWALAAVALVASPPAPWRARPSRADVLVWIYPAAALGMAIAAYWAARNV